MHSYKIPNTYAFSGRHRTINEIAELSGMSPSAVRYRLKHAIPLDGPAPRPEPYRFDYRGEALTLAQIVERTGLSKTTVWKRTMCGRYLEGDELRDPYPEPRHNARMVSYRGQTKCLADWGKTVGIDGSTLRARIAKGWSIQDALTTPVHDRNVKGHNVRLITRIIEGVTRINNRVRIDRMVNAFKGGGYSQTFPDRQRTGDGRHLVERGQTKLTIRKEIQTSEARQ